MADQTVTIQMLAFRQGWFWPEPLYEGEKYELPPDVALYLVELDVAKEVKPRASKSKDE